MKTQCEIKKKTLQMQLAEEEIAPMKILEMINELMENL